MLLVKLTKTQRKKKTDTWTWVRICLLSKKKRKEAMTHIRNDDRKLWVECMVHLADGSFITPEGIVVLAVLSIRVADCGEHLVPRSGIGVCLWHAVWWLPTNQNKDWYLLTGVTKLFTLCWLWQWRKKSWRCSTHVYLCHNALLFNIDHCSSTYRKDKNGMSG